MNALFKSAEIKGIKIDRDTVLLITATMKTDQKSLKSLCVRTLEGFEFLLYSRIVRIKADGDVTYIYVLNQEKPVKALQTFSAIECRLQSVDNFFKCHRSHIVNMKHVKRYCSKMNMLITEAGDVPVSDSCVHEFKEMYCR